MNINTSVHHVTGIKMSRKTVDNGDHEPFDSITVEFVTDSGDYTVTAINVEEGCTVEMTQ